MCDSDTVKTRFQYSSEFALWLNMIDAMAHESCQTEYATKRFKMKNIFDDLFILFLPVCSVGHSWHNGMPPSSMCMSLFNLVYCMQCSRIIVLPCRSQLSQRSQHYNKCNCASQHEILSLTVTRIEFVSVRLMHNLYDAIVAVCRCRARHDCRTRYDWLLTASTEVLADSKQDIAADQRQFAGISLNMHIFNILFGICTDGTFFVIPPKISYSSQFCECEVNCKVGDCRTLMTPTSKTFCLAKVDNANFGAFVLFFFLFMSRSI